MEHLSHWAPSSEESLSNITLPSVSFTILRFYHRMFCGCVVLGSFKDTNNYCMYVFMIPIKLMQASQERLTELGVFLTNDSNQ